MTTRRDFLRYSTLGAAGLCLGPAHLGLLGKYASLYAGERNLQVLVLKGKPRERGRIHGESLKERILEASERLRTEFHPPLGTNVSDHVAKFIADTAFRGAIEKWTPNLLEEIKGIAEATGLPFDIVFAMQLPDEQWWYTGNARIRNLRENADERTPDKEGKCTVVGASRTTQGPAIVGQNLDLPSSWQGDRVILRVRHDSSELESLVVTDPGFVGANGINNQGVAVCVNALLQLDNSPHGLPVAFVVRGVLERRTREDAELFVQSVRHASGQAYSIGDRDRVVCYECSANRVVPFVDRDGVDRFVHTNHPLANDDLGLIGKHWQGREQRAPSNSAVRYQAAQRRIADRNRPVDVDTLKAILSSHDSHDHPICLHLSPDRGAFTAACTIFELGEGPRMHITGGPPCKAPFEILGF